MPCCAFTISVCAFAGPWCRQAHPNNNSDHELSNPLHAAHALHSRFLCAFVCLVCFAGPWCRQAHPNNNSNHAPPTRCVRSMPCIHVSFVLFVWCALQDPGAGKLTQMMAMKSRQPARKQVGPCGSLLGGRASIYFTYSKCCFIRQHVNVAPHVEHVLPHHLHQWYLCEGWVIKRDRVARKGRMHIRAHTHTHTHTHTYTHTCLRARSPMLTHLHMQMHADAHQPPFSHCKSTITRVCLWQLQPHLCRISTLD